MEFAQESEKTKKAREKLKKKLAAMDNKINPQAIERKTKEIQRWIDRQQPRITLREKSISLFDENQHSAIESRKVANLALRLGEDLSKPLELLLQKKIQLVD